MPPPFVYVFLSDVVEAGEQARGNGDRFNMRSLLIQERGMMFGDAACPGGVLLCLCRS
jgi:hypothetical protein